MLIVIIHVAMKEFDGRMISNESNAERESEIERTVTQEKVDERRLREKKMYNRNSGLSNEYQISQAVQRLREADALKG